MFPLHLGSYGRVYATAADPYHHAVGPTTTYGMGTVVSWQRRTQLCLEVTRGVAPPPSHPDDTFCQQAGLYRGGYNRFTPYWGAARPWEEEQPDGWLSDQSAVQLIPWRCGTRSLSRWRNVSRCHAPYWRGWTDGRCKYCGTPSESVLLKL